MKLTKRVIATILCIIILALSPMASYIDATSIVNVHAVGPAVALGTDFLYGVVYF